MAGISLQDAEAARAAALVALTSALNLKESQVSGSVGGRKTVRHDIQQLQAVYDRWDAICKRLGRGGNGPTFSLAVPCG